jgi:hypothetical protein
MLYKIKETKANLLALNDEQLQTTTTLTILQNKQLTTELQYQSQMTEDLLQKTNKQQAQISTLKRDIEIHREVEKELAKRTHFCQKYIKKLKQQIKDMQDKEDGKSQTNEYGRPAVMGIRGGHAKNKSMGGNDLAAKANEDFVSFLEHKLEEIEKKL